MAPLLRQHKGWRNIETNIGDIFWLAIERCCEPAAPNSLHNISYTCNKNVPLKPPLSDPKSFISHHHQLLPMKSFTELPLIEPLQHAISDAGYSVPTPIQAQCIIPLLEGKDLLGRAQTGTGKTAAFIVPTLQRLWL